MTNEEILIAKLEAINANIIALRSETATKSDLAAVRSEMVTKEDASHFATKEDLDIKQVEVLEVLREYSASKADLQEAKSEIMTHVDGLAASNQKFDQELLMIRNRQDRLETRMA